MEIGILGAGNVGRALGEGWKKAGHDVVYGSRTPGEGTVSLADAASRPVVVLTVPYVGAEETLRALGDFGGRVLVDATNAIKPDFSGLLLSNDTSAGEQVGEWATGAKVVKAFNTIGYEIMLNPVINGTAVSLLYAGDDIDAKATVSQLAADLGFDPVDAGNLAQSRLLEAFAWLWITMAFKTGHGRTIGFRFLKGA